MSKADSLKAKPAPAAGGGACMEVGRKHVQASTIVSGSSLTVRLPVSLRLPSGLVSSPPPPMCDRRVANALLCMWADIP